MPGGGRRTHEFPFGKPVLLSFLEVASAGLFVLVLGVSVLVNGFDNWRAFVPAIAVVIAFETAKSLLLERYERIGKAIALKRKRITVVVRFPHGFPKPMLAARLSFFIVVACMLLFGCGPFSFDTATHGIIGCVFGLIGVAVLNLALEHHYVKAQRAIEVEYDTKQEH